MCGIYTCGPVNLMYITPIKGINNPNLMCVLVLHYRWKPNNDNLSLSRVRTTNIQAKIMTWTNSHFLRRAPLASENNFMLFTITETWQPLNYTLNNPWRGWHLIHDLTRTCYSHSIYWKCRQELIVRYCNVDNDCTAIILHTVIGNVFVKELFRGCFLFSYVSSRNSSNLRGGNTSTSVK